MANDATGADQHGGGEQADTTVTLADDALYRALASTRRRQLLAVLRDTGPGGTSIDELATLLCGYDATETGTMGTPSDRDRLLVELTHVHLPHLDALGMVEYDQEAETVTLRPLDPEVEELIDRSVTAEPSRRP